MNETRGRKEFKDPSSPRRAKVVASIPIRGARRAPGNGGEYSSSHWLALDSTEGANFPAPEPEKRASEREGWWWCGVVRGQGPLTFSVLAAVLLPPRATAAGLPFISSGVCICLCVNAERTQSAGETTRATEALPDAEA
jgi:hypothetical protein